MSPCTPEGTSIATTGTSARPTASIVSRATPSSGRARPAPNSAVDHQPGAGDQRRVEGQRLALPRRGRHGGVAAQPLARAEQGDPHRPAAPGEMARGDEAVAAVVAGAAQHERRAGREACADRPGDRRARVLHELDARHARGDRGGIGGAHLGDGEQAAVPADRRRAWCQPHRTGRAADQTMA